MTYENCLEELESIGLKDAFLNDFDGFITELVKKSDKIHSTASMLRGTINKADQISFENWCHLIHYLMTPDFVKDRAVLESLRDRIVKHQKIKHGQRANN